MPAPLASCPWKTSTQATYRAHSSRSRRTDDTPAPREARVQQRRLWPAPIRAKAGLRSRRRRNPATLACTSSSVSPHSAAPFRLTRWLIADVNAWPVHLAFCPSRFSRPFTCAAYCPRSPAGARSPPGQRRGCGESGSGLGCSFRSGEGKLATIRLKFLLFCTARGRGRGRRKHHDSGEEEREAHPRRGHGRRDRCEAEETGASGRSGRARAWCLSLSS